MDLFEKNAEAFQARFPAVWEILSAAASPKVAARWQGDRAVNIEIDGTPLYPDDAETWSREQVTGYFQDPDRLRVDDPATRPMSPGVAALLPRLEAFLAAEVGGLASAPVVDIGFAFVFGVGLGYHLAPLVERCGARTVVLVEPVPDFLRLSLSAIDWGALFDAAERAGASFRLIVGRSAERTMLEIEGLLIHGTGRPFLDGSYAYLHYPSWDLRQARLLLNQRLPNFLVHPSCLEDERLMLENTVGNLAREDGGARLIDGVQAADPGVALFVVGSGPSLDNDLSHIARLRDRAVILSCGSALGILLKHGIRPDFHIENENTPNLVVNLRGFAEAYGLEGIRLLGATTVPPEAGALFAERWLYVRAMLSPSAILGLDAEPLPYTGPVVANAATAVATALGFREIYLFGVDCGRRPGAGHHARDAVYNEAGYDNFVTEKGDSAEALETDFTRTVPGNFGGEISTSPFLDLSRRTMAELQRLRGLSFVNCSDGARIDGARPKNAGALDLPLPAQAPAATVERLAARLRPIPAGWREARADLSRHLAQCDAVEAGLAARLEEARSADWEFWDLERSLKDFFKGLPPEAEGVVRLVSGSIDSLGRLALYRGVRIADAGRRRAYLRFVVDQLAGDGAAVVAEARRLLQDLAIRMDATEGQP